MLKYILLILLGYIPNLIFSQDQFLKTLHFSELMSFENYSNLIAKDGGCILGLNFRLPTNIQGSAVIKTDAKGSLEWTYSFTNEFNISSFLFQIIERDDVGFFAIGYEGLPFKGFVILIDKDGNFQWRKDYLPGFQLAVASAIKTNDGGIVIVGEFAATPNEDVNCCLIKLDSNANVDWAQSYEYIGYSFGLKVIELDHGGYMLGGAVDIAGSDREAYVIRTNANGDRIWAKTFGSALSFAVNQIGNDSFLLAMLEGIGNSYTTNLICINEQGDKIWSKKRNDDKLISITDSKLSNDGNRILLSGQIQKDDSRYYGLLMSMTKNGEIQWAKSYRVTDSDGYQINLAPDGGYFLTGDDNDVLNDDNIVMIKTDSQGNAGCLEQDETILLTDYDFVSDTVGYSVPFTVQVVEGVNMPILLNPIESTICTTVATYEQHNPLAISISPNPVSDELTIQLSEGIMNGTIKIAITDLTGKLLLTEKYFNYYSTYRVNTANLANGLYFLTVKSDDSSQTIKFVVNH